VLTPMKNLLGLVKQINETLGEEFYTTMQLDDIKHNLVFDITGPKMFAIRINFPYEELKSLESPDVPYLNIVQTALLHYREHLNSIKKEAKQTFRALKKELTVNNQKIKEIWEKRG